MSGTVLYAPNVHTGGGLVLLQGLLATWPADGPHTAILDARARALLQVPGEVRVHWVHATVASRLAAERTLQAACGSSDTVLCFHGLPPLLRCAARVVVFQQNRNLLGLNPLSDFTARTGVRIAFERFISRRLRHRVAEYIVQTPTMARQLAHWYGAGCPRIRVLPFIDHWPSRPPGLDVTFDFVYVADGEAMKNHGRLLEAWQLLAVQGSRPSLALTLGPRDAALAAHIDALRVKFALNIVNLGHMPRNNVLKLYAQSRALIFPSISESFGLPLIEARHLGLPIVAAELDYVRDVCTPVQTFDPLSATSIARAVQRFLGDADAPVQVGEPQSLWAALSPNTATADGTA